MQKTEVRGAKELANAWQCAGHFARCWMAAFVLTV